MPWTPVFLAPLRFLNGSTRHRSVDYPRSGTRILFVDDDDNVLRSMQRRLRNVCRVANAFKIFPARPQAAHVTTMA